MERLQILSARSSRTSVEPHTLQKPIGFSVHRGVWVKTEETVYPNDVMESVARYILTPHVEPCTIATTGETPGIKNPFCTNLARSLIYSWSGWRTFSMSSIFSSAVPWKRFLSMVSIAKELRASLATSNHASSFASTNQFTRSEGSAIGF